jgi:hypothetical protein
MHHPANTRITNSVAVAKYGELEAANGRQVVVPPSSAAGANVTGCRAGQPLAEASVVLIRGCSWRFLICLRVDGV